MCDFHSVVVRADGALAHVAENSHSTAVSKAGWRENEPLKRPVFIEAEWDGQGKYPGATKICRLQSGESMTAAQLKAVDRHYLALATMLQDDKPPAAVRSKFSDPEFADVISERILLTQPNASKMLGYLQRRIFRELLSRNRPSGLAFPQRFADAIHEGADLSLVWPRFVLWMLTDPAAGVIKYAKKEAAQEAIKAVVALFQRWLDGCKPPASEWESARRNSWAADAAAYATAAADAAAYAAAAASDASSASSARLKHYELMANKLIELVREAKLP